MEIHVLYDNRPQPDKLPLLMKELHRQNIIPTKIWEPVQASTVLESINLSHKAIIRYAKDQGLSEIAVFEDDCQIPSEFGWNKFIISKPAQFDIYLAGTYGLNRPITNPISMINGFHCYIMRSSFYDRFLSIPDNVHCDTALDRMGLFYVHYPFIALQRPGWSANCRAHSDKNAELTDEDVYGGLPK